MDRVADMDKTLPVVLVGEYAETGGARTFFERLAQFFLDANVELAIVFPAGSPPRLPLKAGQRPPTLIPMTFPLNQVRLKHFPKWLVRNPITYLNEASEIKSRISEIFGSKKFVTLYSISSPGRFISGIGQETQTVHILHSYPRGPLHYVVGPIFGRRAVSEGICLVAVSDFLSRKISSYWRLPSQSAPTTILNTGGPAKKIDFQVSKEVPMVLSVGIANRAKSPKNFVRVARDFFRIFPDSRTRFVWVGNGPALKSAKNLARRLGVKNKVEFPGFCDDVEGYYERASIYLQLSRVDSMPLAAIDAMRFGLPILVTRRGGLPELLPPRLRERFSFEKNGRGSHVLISELLRNPDFLQASSRDFEEYYSRRFAEQRWQTALKQIISGARGCSIIDTR